MRALPILAGILLLATGCLDPSVAPTDADEPTPSSGGPSVDAPGAQLEAIESGVNVTWKGTLQPTAGQPSVDPRWPTPRTSRDGASHRLTFPPEVTILEAKLKWSTGDNYLTFIVYGANGDPMCGSLTGRSGEAECLATLHQKRAKAETWTANIRSSLAPNGQAPIQYTLTLTLRTTPLPWYGPPAPYGAGLAFDAPVVVTERGDEPAIAITKAGVVYVTPRVFVAGGLYRSDDGSRFSRVDTGELPYCEPTRAAPVAATPPAAEGLSHVGCGDTDVATSGANTVYFSSHWGAEAVAASHDGGRTWFSNPFGTGPTIPHTDRQWLAASGEMRAWLVYAGLAPLGAPVSRTLDGGRTWLEAGHAPGNTCVIGSIFRAPDGTLYLAGCNAQGPAVGVSTDDGVTWTWKTAARTPRSGGLYFMNLVTGTVDAAGNVHLGWIQREDAGGSNVYVASSKDKGATWTTPTRVNQANGTYVFVWITSGEAGRVALSYYGTKAVGTPARIIGDWYVLAAVTEDVFAPTPAWTEGAASPDFMQYGPVCIGGNSCAHARNLGDFFQIQAGPGGLLHIAYTDGSLGGGDSVERLTASGRTMFARQSGGPNLGAASVDKNGGS